MPRANMGCTIVPKGIVRFRSCIKAVVNIFPHKAEPSCATRTGQYLLERWYDERVRLVLLINIFSTFAVSERIFLLGFENEEIVK